MYVLLSINLCQVNNQECFSLLTSSDIEGEMKGEMSCHDFQEHLCPWNLEGLLPQSFKAWWNILKKMEHEGESRQHQNIVTHVTRKIYTGDQKDKIHGVFGKLLL